jgi:hypothetical protein
MHSTVAKQRNGQLLIPLLAIKNRYGRPATRPETKKPENLYGSVSRDSRELEISKTLIVLDRGLQAHSRHGCIFMFS